MNSEDKNLLKESVKNKIDDLEKELKLMEEAVKPIAPDVAIGRLSRMDAINNQAVAKAGYDDKKILLSRLILALNVIDKDEYGTCAKCRSEIPFQRLMSVPYSNLCVPCTAKYR